VFGMMEAMLSFLRRQIGLRTDAADVAGSLHAKVKDIVNKVGTPSDSRANNTLFGWLNTPVKSVQRGVTAPSISDVSTTVTISSVNTSKAIVLISVKGAPGDSTDPQLVFRHGMFTAVLSSSTTLTFTRDAYFTATSQSINIAWQVIEFY